MPQQSGNPSKGLVLDIQSDRRWKGMNHKPLCLISMLICLVIACGLEGGAFSVGQAFVLIVPAAILLIWSFVQTDWYEPVQKEGVVHDNSTVQKMPQGSARPRQYRHWLR